MNTILSVPINTRILDVIYNSGLWGIPWYGLQRRFTDNEALDFSLRVFLRQGIIFKVSYLHSVGTIYFMTRKAKDLYGKPEFNDLLEVHIPVRITTEWNYDKDERETTCLIPDNELLTPCGWYGEDIVVKACGCDNDYLIEEAIEKFENNLPEWIRGTIVYDITED